MTPRIEATELVADTKESYARRLFSSLREVFSAESAPYRLVFWREDRPSFCLLRVVTNLTRANKSDDRVIARLPNDPLAVRIAIGNFAAGCKMTTVRWELYTNFACEALLESGRFDQRDLIGDADETRVRQLALAGHPMVGDWDFDGIKDLHTCVNCHALVNLTSFIYGSSTRCEKCGHVPSREQGWTIIAKLMKNASSRDLLPIQMAENDTGFPVQQFMDPIANSVMYWLVGACYLPSFLHPESMPGGFDWHDTYIKMFQRSVFRLVTVETIRDEFREYVATLDPDDPEKWALMISWINFVAESFVTPFTKSVDENDGINDARFLDSSRRAVTMMFPEFTNSVILGQARLQKLQKRTQEKEVSGVA